MRTASHDRKLMFANFLMTMSVRVRVRVSVVALMASHFFGSGLISSGETAWLRTEICVTPNSHLLESSLKLFALHHSKTVWGQLMSSDVASAA